MVHLAHQGVALQPSIFGAAKLCLTFLADVLDYPDPADDGALLVAQGRTGQPRPEHLAVPAHITLVDHKFGMIPGVRARHDPLPLGSIAGMREIERSQLRELCGAITGHAFPGGIGHGKTPVGADYTNPQRDTLDYAVATRFALKSGLPQTSALGNILQRACHPGRNA